MAKAKRVTEAEAKAKRVTEADAKHVAEAKAKRVQKSKAKASGGSSKKGAKPASKKASAKTGSDFQIQLAQNVWPLERDVLYRPDRLKYVRKLVKHDGCVFCAATKKVSFETLCIYQSEHSMIVLNKFPYNSGHVLVIPRRHCGDLLQLSQAEHYDLHDTLRLAMSAISDVYEPGGMNMGMNIGATGGAGIPEHMHYHVIPRWGGDLNFFPLIAETKVVVESLEQTYERLSGYFSTSRSS